MTSSFDHFSVWLTKLYDINAKKSAYVYIYMEILYEALLSVCKRIVQCHLKPCIHLLKNIDSCAKSALASISYPVLFTMSYWYITNQSNLWRHNKSLSHPQILCSYFKTVFKRET